MYYQNKYFFNNKNISVIKKVSVEILKLHESIEVPGNLIICEM